MKNPRNPKFQRGFTLIELLVAMAITSIIVVVLVGITSVALETWNRSRAELRAARQAKSMIDTMARDFESMVTRKGNTSEWLSAVVDPDLSDIGDKLTSTNASRLVFFTAATDRYDGKIGTPDDKGGDVSCVGYQLEYRDPIDANGSVKTFVLNRLLVDPKDTFDKLLGKTDSSTSSPKTLESVFNNEYANELSKPKYFVGENIFQFSVTFHIQVTDSTKTPPVFTVPVSIGETSDKQITKKFAIQGTGLKLDATGGTATAAQLAAGRVSAVTLSVTVLSDFGVEQIKRRTFTTEAQKSEFMAKNSYEYSKTVQLTGM